MTITTMDPADITRRDRIITAVEAARIVAVDFVAAAFMAVDSAGTLAWPMAADAPSRTLERASGGARRRRGST